LEVVVAYQEDIARVVELYRDDIEADLHAAKRVLEKIKAEAGEAERRVLAFEALLAFDPGRLDSSAEMPMGKLTLHVAMQVVLRDAPNQMMRPTDLAAEVHRRGLYRMRDGRPVEAQQIHARVGNYPDLFAREGTFVKLVAG
jgi:hypothetical protein